MRRHCVALVLVLILVQLLALPVFAAADDSNAWTIIDSIGNFFKDLISTIVNLGKSFFESILKGMEFLLSGLKTLFIPHDDYFDKMTDRIYTAFEKKFGSVLSLANYLKARFSDLRAYKGDLFIIQFPSDHLFGGSKIDLLSGAGGIANMIRGAFSGFVVLCTVAFAYKKVVAMINA